MSFYYFVASLPAVSLMAPPPLRADEYRAEARRLLDPATVTELDSIMTGDGESARSALAGRWRAVNTQMRNACARTRASMLDVDAAPHLRPHAGFSNYIEQAVVEAYAKANPMERELSLDRFRWALLDEWAREAPFGLDAVLAYGLKVKLAERWARLSDEAGRARLTETIGRVREALASQA